MAHMQGLCIPLACTEKCSCTHYWILLPYNPVSPHNIVCRTDCLSVLSSDGCQKNHGVNRCLVALYVCTGRAHTTTDDASSLVVGRKEKVTVYTVWRFSTLAFSDSWINMCLINFYVVELHVCVYVLLTAACVCCGLWSAPHIPQ